MATTDVDGPPPPSTKIGLDMETDGTAHTLKRHNQFIHYITEVSEGVRIGISNKSKMSRETNKRRVAWIFNMLGPGTEVRVPAGEQGLLGFESPAGAKGGNIQAFLSACPKCGAQEEKEGVKLKSYQQTQK